MVLRREHVTLCGYRVLRGGGLVRQQFRGERDLGPVVALRPQSCGQCLARSDPALEPIQLGLRLRVVQPDKDCARLDDVAVDGVQLRDDPALKVLDQFALAGHLDDAGCDSGAVQRGQGCPAPGHAEEHGHDGEAGERDARETQGCRIHGRRRRDG